LRDLGKSEFGTNKNEHAQNIRSRHSENGDLTRNLSESSNYREGGAS